MSNETEPLVEPQPSVGANNAAWNICHKIESERGITINREWVAREIDFQTRHCSLVAALESLTKHYVELVKSGDAGNWNPETEHVIIQAREALDLAKGKKK